MNDKNLIPFSQRTESEQREIRSKGGKASAKARMAKKTFRDLLEVNLATTATNSSTGEVRTIKDIGMIELAKQVKQGNLKAIKLAAELLGEFRHNVDLNSEGMKVNVSVADKETADLLQKVINAND